jgi:predicted XRE-type DNA-binding protein
MVAALSRNLRVIWLRSGVCIKFDTCLIDTLPRLATAPSLSQEGELSKWIAENHLKQADAAEILMVSRPRVSDVVNMKVGKFTIDTLVNMMSRIGKPVRLVVA